MVMLSRRFVLSGLIAAPAVVAANKLMPVKALPFEPYMVVTGTDWRTGEIITRKLFDGDAPDSFVRAEFLDKYVNAIKFMENVKTAYAWNKNEEKNLKFMAPHDFSNISMFSPVRNEYKPVRMLEKFNTFEGYGVDDSDPLFYMDDRQLAAHGVFDLGGSGWKVKT